MLAEVFLCTRQALMQSETRPKAQPDPDERRRFKKDHWEYDDLSNDLDLLGRGSGFCPHDYADRQETLDCSPAVRPTSSAPVFQPNTNSSPVSCPQDVDKGSHSGPSITIQERSDHALTLSTLALSPLVSHSFWQRYDDLQLGSGPSGVASPLRQTLLLLNSPCSLQSPKTYNASLNSMGNRVSPKMANLVVDDVSLPLCLPWDKAGNAGPSDAVLNGYLQLKVQELLGHMLTNCSTSPQRVMNHLQHLSLEESVEELSMQVSRDQNMKPERARSAVMLTLRHMAGDLPEVTASNPFAASDGDLHSTAPLSHLAPSISLPKPSENGEVSVPTTTAVTTTTTTSELYKQAAVVFLLRCPSATQYLHQFTSWDRSTSGGDSAPAGKVQLLCEQTLSSTDLDSDELRVSSEEGDSGLTRLSTHDILVSEDMYSTRTHHCD
uniref:uncharacterized protein isoform X2 n=1 Tax=Myxine glutinosa TaxID=7769 RepID=UPI00359026E3